MAGIVPKVDILPAVLAIAPVQQIESTQPATNPVKSRMIGRYKLLQVLGEGGMGIVWMAEQTEPVRRRVALKLIKEGIDNKQVIARFEAERQALAMMDHHNIAKVHDAGTTENGQPYFVMELVQGIPLNEYCDSNRLSIDDRLNLFMPVCKAIQHAHQKGIIHRDLKPGNVLVCLYDGQPVPKVIDFGLAKALEHRSHLTDKTMFTEFGQVVGTLQYMSPEQAEMNQLDIDCRTDIYSLGVLLYELLAGSTPIEKESLRNVAILTVLETIRENEPPRPSLRLSSDTTEAIRGISKQRQIEPSKLENILRGELDWIVMKAIERDRARRYDSAEAFAEDIERYLKNEAVLARPPSLSYRFQKLYHQNQARFVSVTAAIALLATGGLVLAIVYFSNLHSLRNERVLVDAAAKKALEARVRAADQMEALAKATELAEWRLEQAENGLQEATQRRDSAIELRRHANATSEEAERRLMETEERARIAREEQERAEEKLRQLRVEKNRIATRFGDLKDYEGDRTPVIEAESSRRDTQSDDQISATFVGHLGAVATVAFCPERPVFASGGNDATVRLWNANTGKELFVLKGHSNVVIDLCFSRDGLQLVSGSFDGSLRIWDVENGVLVRDINGLEDAVKSVAISANGKQIVTGLGNGNVGLLKASSGELIRTFVGHKKPVMGVAFSPDGLYVASGSLDDVVRIWNVGSGAQVAELREHNNWITEVVFSPNGKWLASSSGDGTIKQWDTHNWKLIRSIRAHTGVVESLAVSQDGEQLVSGSSDRTVRVWDARTGEQITILRGHDDNVAGVDFNSAGTQVVSGSADETVRLWSLAKLGGAEGSRKENTR